MKITGSKTFDLAGAHMDEKEVKVSEQMMIGKNNTTTTMFLALMKRMQQESWDGFIEIER
jgi:hypothetical protein